MGDDLSTIIGTVVGIIISSSIAVAAIGLALVLAGIAARPLCKLFMMGWNVWQ